MSLSAFTAGTTKRFTEPGRVASAFMHSRARVVGIMGPQGGGKTTSVINRILMKAATQPPSPVTGQSYYRCVVWMRTYRELWAKVVPDWLEWVPKKYPGMDISWTGGVDNPAEHKFRFRAVYNGVERICNAEVWFRAIGDQTPGEAAKGLHMTDGWLPEATSATAEMRKAMFGRLGRYPQQTHGGAPERQLFCDWNAGDPYNWTSEYFIYERPLDLDKDGRPLVEFYCQPGGREPTAENLHNLPPGYYQDQVAANADDPDWIRRMVDNKIGFIKDGKPVFGEFDDQQHVSQGELTPWRGVPLILAADAGLTPAAVLMQRDSMGRAQVLREIVTTRSGPEAFGEEVLEALADPRFRGLPAVVQGWGDPSSANAAESSSEGEGAQLLSWMKIMTVKTKITWKPSRCGNDPVIRQGAVRQMLRRRIDGAAAFAVDRVHCPELIKALARDYKFKRRPIVTSAGIEYQDKPEKNFASHVANALEYAAANAGEQDILTGKAERREALKRAAAAQAARAAAAAAQPYDPLARR